MVTVFPINQFFTINIHEDPKNKTVEGRVQFIVQPLRYKQKVLINTATVSHVKGETFIDQGASTFLTIKHSLKKVTGLKGHDGKEFKLEFETVDDYEILTDECAEALVNCELGFILNFYAKDAITSTPHEIKNPATFKPLAGVEFKPWNEKSKKKS